MKEYQLIGKYSDLSTKLDDDIYEELVDAGVRLVGTGYNSGTTVRVKVSSCRDKSISGWTLIHRYVWERKTGTKLSSKDIIDHYDNDALNNQFSNLRLSNYRDNRQKCPVAFDRSKTGYRGVSLRKSRSKGIRGTKHLKYQLNIWRDKKSHFLCASNNAELLASIYDMIYRDYMNVPNYIPNVSKIVTMNDLINLVEPKYFERIDNFINSL